MTAKKRGAVKKLLLGIDLGSSNHKAVLVDGEGRLRGFLKAEADLGGPDAARDVARRLTGEFGVKWERLAGIHVTGIGGKGNGEDIDGVPVRVVDEFTAIGAGGLALARKDRALVVSMGTGTVFVKAGRGRVGHLGGSGVGGGAVSGVCRYLYGVERFPDIMAMAEKGDLGKVDLKVGDLAASQYIDLPPDLTSANFGKIGASASREDFIAGLVNMVLETVGVMAVLACRAGKMDTAVLCGAVTILPQVKSVFKRFSKRTGVTFVVPENSTYAIAVGAALAGMRGVRAKKS